VIMSRFDFDDFIEQQRRAKKSRSARLLAGLQEMSRQAAQAAKAGRPDAAAKIANEGIRMGAAILRQLPAGGEKELKQIAQGVGRERQELKATAGEALRELTQGFGADQRQMNGIRRERVQQRERQRDLGLVM
jgi:hypothetical protein